MHIVMFNLYFHPDPYGTGLILGELARDLVQRGHQVTVVTAVTHYGLDAPAATPRGRWIFEETWEGVRILRTAVPAGIGQPMLRRLLIYLSYTWLSMVAGLRVPRPDVVFGVLPPVTTGPSVWLVSRLRHVPLVLSVQDVYPDSVFGGGWLAGLNRLVERFVLRRGTRLITLSQGQRDALVARGADPSRIHVVPMWTDLDGIQPGPRHNAFRSEHASGATLIALYSGNLGKFSGVGVVLEAASLLRDDQRIRFLVVGRGHGRDDLMRRAADLDLPNLAFLPTQPRERLAEMLAAADVGLVTLDPRLSVTNVPSKTFTIMAAGRPVLAAVHPDNEVARLVVAVGCGAITPPDGAKEIADVLRSWADDASSLDAMGSRARIWVQQFHDRRSAVQAHEQIFAGQHVAAAGTRG